jgi:DNA-binding LacI/PurR family transcriptional regulator
VTTRLAAVAKFAGVSEATVSRVLRGKPGVAQATKETVLTALDVFGFARPQPVRTERARLIGLVLPDLQNPIFPAFAEAIGVSLIRRGLVPVLCTRTSDGVSEAHYIEMLLAQQAGGIIFVGSSYADAGPEQCQQLAERGLPVVLINAADENLGVPRVCVDDTSAAEQAMAHLSGLGHERIGLVLGPLGHVPSERKMEGFEQFWLSRGTAQGRNGQVLGTRPRRGADQSGAPQHSAERGNRLQEGAERGGSLRNGGERGGTPQGGGDRGGKASQQQVQRPWEDWIEHTVFSVEGGRTAANRLFASKGVTALVCASDALALGAVRAARKLGLDVPKDVSVVGFDDSTYMGVTDPPLTTVRQPVRAMAAAAVSSLLAQLEGRRATGDEILFEPELIVRGTSGPARVNAL